jgi:hypothetical protein
MAQGMSQTGTQIFLARREPLVVPTVNQFGNQSPIALPGSDRILYVFPHRS